VGVVKVFDVFCYMLYSSICSGSYRGAYAMICMLSYTGTCVYNKLFLSSLAA
jgi:hypothetical protein